MEQELTTELGILTCLGVLATMLWLPYVVGVSKAPLASDSFNRPADLSKVQPWVHRTHPSTAVHWRLDLLSAVCCLLMAYSVWAA